LLLGRDEKLLAHEFGFVAGTAAKYVGEVFDAVLAGIGGVGGGDAVGNVADEDDVFAVCGLGDGEIGVAAEDGLDFDEVDAASNELVDVFVGLSLSRDDQ